MAGDEGAQPSLPRLASSPRPQYSPQCCSSEASEQSLMPLQCLLVGMQVPFGHWKPLHFFSEIQNWVDVCVGFSEAAFSERQRAMAQPQPPSPVSACFWRDENRPPQGHLSEFVEIHHHPTAPQQRPLCTLPQLVGSSSEPSWQSASPSQAQRCGMQWPFWHWKLDASQV